MARRVQGSKLVVVAVNPVQYHVHLYRALAAAGLDLEVFYASKIGLVPYFDPMLNRELRWHSNLLEGYRHRFLERADAITGQGALEVNSADLARALDEANPDVVLVYGYANLDCWRAFFWAITRRRRIFLVGDSELLRERSGWRVALKRLLLPLLFGRIDTFLTVGSRNEDYYRAHGVPESRMQRAPFTIAEADLKQAAARRDAIRPELLQRHGIPADRIVVLYVGKLYPGKRPFDVLRAVGKAAAAGAAVHALFVGSGSDQTALEAEAQRLDLPASFAGFVNLDAIADYFAAADMLVLASEIEAYGIVLLEGACAGLPLIASNRIGGVGPSDAARPGENALVYPAGDVDALAAAVGRLCEDAELRAAYGRRSREIFDELDVQRAVDGICRALSSVSRGRANDRQSA